MTGIYIGPQYIPISFLPKSIYMTILVLNNTHDIRNTNIIVFTIYSGTGIDIMHSKSNTKIILLNIL